MKVELNGLWKSAKTDETWCRITLRIAPNGKELKFTIGYNGERLSENCDKKRLERLYNNEYSIFIDRLPTLLLEASK